MNRGPIMWGGIYDENGRLAHHEPSEIKNDGTTVFFYEEVNGRGDRLINSLKAIDDYQIQNGSEKELQPIYLHIYSYGGALFTGFNIMNAIEQIKSPVYAVIDGIAASAATLIAMGCDKIFMKRNAQFMIHQLSSVMYGTHEQFEDELNLQNDLMSQIADIYARKSNLPIEQIKEMLKRDTFINAENAVRWGFADGIFGEETMKPGLSISFSNVLTPVDSNTNSVSSATTVEILSSKENVMAKKNEQQPNVEVEEVEEEKQQTEQVESTEETTTAEGPVTKRLLNRLAAKASESEEVTNEDEGVLTLLKSLMTEVQQLKSQIATMNTAIKGVDGRLSDFEQATDVLIDTVVNIIPAKVAKQIKKSDAEIEVEASVVKHAVVVKPVGASTASLLRSMNAPGMN